MESIGGIQQRYDKLIEQYAQLAAQYQAQIKSVSQKIVLSGWIRLLVFMLLITVPVYIYDFSQIASIALFVGFALSFGLLIKRFNKFKRLKAELESMRNLNLNEVKAQQGEWSSFESGVEFIDPAHDYSHDLDMFGPGSFFQYINRTSTSEGKLTLKNKIISPYIASEDIISEQEAIKELSNKLDFRQHFYAKGKMLEETPADIERIKAFKNYEYFIKSKGPLFKFMVIALPWMFVISLALTFFGFQASVPTLLFLVNLAFIGIHLKALNKVNQRFTSLTALLQKYAVLTDLVAHENFSSSKLLQLQNSLSEADERASAIIDKLSGYMSQFDQRNGLAGFLLNGIMLWDFKYVGKIEKWLSTYDQKIEQWLYVVHQIDALNSMAGYAHNHPDFVFPVPHQNTMLKATALGHPLLDRKERVCNDYDFEDSIFSLITGANMSGKSTFLRTVGLNMVSARSGMPVCGTSMVFRPMPMITNMRTTDSLTKHESYFYAELKKLQYIIERLKNGNNVFIILDEILKGTNSKDKTYGSMELIKHLLSLNAHGMIATHDLELGVLQESTKGKIVNRCFEVENKDNKLIFDYKLHPGVTQNHNATFLMKQMGIIRT